jgi:hypothetical protein
MRRKEAPKINAIEPRDDELIELIKKYIFLQYDDDSMINAILTESGNLITRDQLKMWKQVALREKKEAKLEIDVYLKNMLELGMFEDVKTQYEIAKTMLITNSKTYHQVVKKGDINMQIALTNTIDKQMEGMRKIITSMGYLTKAKEVMERGFSGAGALDDKAGTTITIEAKPGSSFDEVVDQSIGEIELRENEIF